ncbi:hypothetical protein [Kitasatospora sp. McL0602]|uniref:hypothetical protein n=1 Tax=Kitasatospora sp. McL0602 TaxID=3439530 RepID=UPI003F899E0B
MIDAPNCPTCEAPTEWADDDQPDVMASWDCPACRTFGIWLPDDYVRRHPGEEQVFTIGQRPALRVRHAA